MFWEAGLMIKSVMILLLVFSLYSWFIVFKKYRAYKHTQQETDEFLTTFWKCKNLSEAHKFAQATTMCPEANIFKLGYIELQKLGKKQVVNENGDEETLETRLAGMETLTRTLRKAENIEVERLGKSLPFLATVGSTSPFIGLFGTVWGVMISFHDISIRGSASLLVVAPGISEALVVTAAGLAVAIPAVVFYNHYSNILLDIEGKMHNFSTDFLNLVERDLLSRG